MEKEILTRDKFAKDFAGTKLKGLIFGNFFAFSLAWVCLLLISMLLKFPILHIVGGIGLMLVYLGSLVDFIIKYTKLRNGRYSILKDEVIGTDHTNRLEMTAYYYFWGIWFLLAKAPYNLSFKCYGLYIIPFGENYAWSKMHNMMESSVYNSSNIGDEFYVISFDNKKIALAYNTKFFELKD